MAGLNLTDNQLIAVRGFLSKADVKAAQLSVRSLSHLPTFPLHHLDSPSPLSSLVRPSTDSFVADYDRPRTGPKLRKPTT